MKKLLKYVRECKMFVCAPDGFPADNRRICSPSTTEGGKFPDGTLSADKRLIWGGRGVNSHCQEQDYWFLETPSIGELAIWYMHIRAKYPGIPIQGTKRGAESAFTLRRPQPDAALLFGAEFDLGYPSHATVLIFYLGLPFGFPWSPGILGRVMQRVEWLHMSPTHPPPIP